MNLAETFPSFDFRPGIYVDSPLTATTVYTFTYNTGKYVEG